MKTETNVAASVAGLAVSVFVSLLLVSVLQLPQGMSVLLAATIHMTAILGANAVGVRIAGYFLRQSVEGVAYRSSLAAAWIGPLAVYVAKGSIYAVPVAAVGAANLVLLFRTPEKPEPPQPDDDLIFHLLQPPSMTRVLSLVAAAFCLQVTLATGAAGLLSVASALVSVAAAIVTWHARFRISVPAAPKPAREWASAGLTLALAFILTSTGLRLGFGGGGDGPESGVTDGPGGKYWGVFLMPDVPPTPARLQSPVRTNDDLRADRVKIPLKIAFDGVYWIFRWPDIQPPARASIFHGSPVEMGFSSADDMPISLEAHQNLPNHVDLASAGKIELLVRNSDSYPGTVFMELILTDSSLGRILSLGQLPVGSAVPGAPQRPIEKLTFPVPENPAIIAFDQIIIRFRMHHARATHSPRMAVDSLSLIPR